MEEEKKLKMNPALKTILYVIRDKGGCGYYRCFQPALKMRQFSLMNTITDVGIAKKEHIDQADIVVFQEVGSTQNTKSYQYALKSGKAVVVEVDDLLHMVSPNNPGYASWNPGTLFVQRSVEKMKKAHAMTVTTPQLARDYAPFNDNIYVIPNYLSEQRWDMPVTRKNDGIIRIGWAGGNSHLDDLKLVAPVIEKIVKEYEGKVKFETMGMLEKEFKGTFRNLDKFAHHCPKCDYHGDVEFRPGESLENYQQILATFGWNIALAPIVNTAFNCAKSDLKLKEYAALGVAPIASRVTPYIEAQKDGCNVLLAETFDEWYNAIKELIDNPEKRAKIVEENNIWKENNWIAKNIKKQSDIYHQIIANSSKEL